MQFDPGSPWFNFPAALVNYKPTGFASGQLGFLTAVIVDLFHRFVNCVSLALKSPSYEKQSFKYLLYCVGKISN